MPSIVPRKSEKTPLLDRFFYALGGGVPSNDPVLHDLIWSLLLRWRAALITASVCSVVVWICAALLIDAGWPLLFIVIDILLCGVKLLLATTLRQENVQERLRVVGWLMLAGFAWALLLGVGVTFCVLSGNATASMVAIGVAAAVIGTVTFRNAPTPRHACLMILAVILPPSFGGLATGNSLLTVLAICLVPWGCCLFLMVRQNYDVIRIASEARHKLDVMAHTDPLTELRNRLAFNSHMQRLRQDQTPRNYTLLYLDLDGFKAVNDTYGHEAGDALLIEVARRMHAVTRQYDALFRLGGDEFAMMLENLPSQEIDAVIARLIQTICKPFDLPNVAQVKIGVSIGSACSDGVAVCPSEVLRAADKALYAAKTGGRGRHVHGDWQAGLEEQPKAASD